MNLRRLSKVAARMSAKERQHYREGELGPGVKERKISPLPVVKKPQIWEMSAHPHRAEIAGTHTDLRLGNPDTGVAHSFVLPRRTELPGPGESTLAVPTFDHSIPYLDYTGKITTAYGRGVVEKGRREKTEVYHADPGDEAGTKLRFNLYEGTHPEEFSIRKDKEGKWFLHNKTQTRTRREDIPASKPSYKEISIDLVNSLDGRQAMMPKLDGASTVIDLKAGRSPRLYSYRVGKKTPTGLIEHTHKMPQLLAEKVPKELDGTMLRAETIAIDRKGKPLPAEIVGGLLNAKVWDSRRKQEQLGARLKAFPFSVIRHKGRNMENAPFNEKLEILRRVEKLIVDLDMPELVIEPLDKIRMINEIKAGTHPLTDEGVVLVDRDRAASPIKAKLVKDYDVFIRKVHPAVSKTGKEHDRAGAVSYSWTPKGPIAGKFGGFKHREAREMLKNPDQYVGRVAKVKARKIFKGKDGGLGAMFQPRFKEWHLDKGDIEKAAFFDELTKIFAPILS